MKVLVIGSGGREHALVRSLVLDPTVTDVWCAPGNGGTGEHATNIDVDASNPAAVAVLAQDLGIDLVVVGPEAPLVAGVADAVRAVGIACFGPSGNAAQLEGSKAFAKDVMAAAGVPTARAHVCTTNDEAEAALDDFGAPYVVKDDGLAAGKGVVVTSDREEALAHANECDRVVIEEYLDGPEVSLFIITDGVDALALSPAQDFKRIDDNDEGPNTGGMGAYTPLAWAPNDLVDEVIATVVHPTLQEMTKRGTPFSGLLYVGLALTSRGTRVVEFNARFGDPDTQAVLARLETPLGELLLAAATGTPAPYRAAKAEALATITRRAPGSNRFTVLVEKSKSTPSTNRMPARSSDSLGERLRSSRNSSSSGREAPTGPAGGLKWISVIRSPRCAALGSPA